MRLQEKAPVVSYALPGSSSPWRVALDPDWPSACAGALGSACRDPGHPVCVHISAVGFIRRVGRLCSRAGVASGCRAQSSQLWGDGRPSRRRHPPRKTAASPHLRPWHPPTTWMTSVLSCKTHMLLIYCLMSALVLSLYL